MERFKVKCKKKWMPTRAYKGDAFDLYARAFIDLKTKQELDIIILSPNGRTLALTGVSIELRHGWRAIITPRSGLAMKEGLGIVNSPGRIDSQYRGEIGVILINLGNTNVILRSGDKIAQMDILKVPDVVLSRSSEINTTTRGDKGFGSTGK